MLTRRMNTLFPASPLSQEFGRLMDTFFTNGDGFTGLGARSFPALNVWEDEHNVIIEAELPGFDMKDLDISLVGDALTISGSRSEEQVSEGTTFHRRERVAGEFTRTIRLATPFDAGHVQATLENGVLKVTLPKGEAARPRKIQVKVA